MRTRQDVPKGSVADPDPDSYVFGPPGPGSGTGNIYTDPDLDQDTYHSIIKPKIVRTTLISTVLFSLWLIIFEE